MASQSSYEYYRDDFSRMPAPRSIAQTLLLDKRVRRVTAAEAYALAKAPPDVMDPALPRYPPAAKRLGLPEGATVLNNCHGRIIGRTAKARRFYTRMDALERRKVEADLREAVYEMQKHPLIKANAILGLDKDLMIKATIVATEDDASTCSTGWPTSPPSRSWPGCTPKARSCPSRTSSSWASPLAHGRLLLPQRGRPPAGPGGRGGQRGREPGHALFRERKKGTLTLAWTSGMRLGMAACHGGIKEIDFSKTREKKYRVLGKRSIAFFGLSARASPPTPIPGQRRHPARRVLQGGPARRRLPDRLREEGLPGLGAHAFRQDRLQAPGAPDWNYVISVQNMGLTRLEGKVLPLGQDVRNPNGRALIDRDLLGVYVNRCAFPDIMVWLMKDSCLPPVVRFIDNSLAVAMGASLMTRRNLAENVSEEDLKKLVFEPFANPFRVYELWRDAEAFLKVFENGSTGSASIPWASGAPRTGTCAGFRFRPR
jgi:phosphoenolpyruvate carboxykinase (ATP)